MQMTDDPIVRVAKQDSKWDGHVILQMPVCSCSNKLSRTSELAALLYTLGGFWGVERKEGGSDGKYEARSGGLGWSMLG